MKKKPIVMMATTLIALLLLTPIVKAGVIHYWWDNVYYVDGTDIDYPHPDNAYYDISRTTDWTKLGNALYHCQINKDSTFQIIVGSLAFSATVGLVVTVWLGGGTTAALVGGLTGIALATFIQMVIDYYFVDERGCIWFWVSVWFVHWLIANLSWLGPLCATNPAVGYGEILIAFVSYGYLRVGSLTFHDALGIGNPVYVNLPPQTPSKPSGTSGITYTSYTYSTSTIDPNNNDVRYQFDWGDGSTTTTGCYPSGSTASTSHSWSSTGTYYVKARAQDTYGAWSGWSSSLTVYISSGGGGGGCPILYVYGGSEYVCEGLLDIHDPDGTDIMTDHTLVTTPIIVHGTYRLRLVEHPQTISHIDQVKLYAILSDETMIELPLVWAWHSENENVLPQLLSSDDWKTEMLGADRNNGVSESVELRFAALSPKLNIIGFVFQIEGNNPFYKV